MLEFPVSLRRLDYSDLDRVMQLEEAAYPFPWTLGIFRDCLRVGYFGTGMFSGEQLIAYSMLTAAAGEAHLLNLCVDPARQRQGFGELLLQHAKEWAQESGIDSMYLEVRPSNKAGISLYRKHGFTVVGERPDYYRAEHGRESALVMRCDLPGPYGQRQENWANDSPF